MQCASYTPFDKDQSPFDVPFKLRPERMDADLALLATRFECIRTYSMTGLEALPELARKHGLKLMIGAWVNSNPVDTEKEVDLLIKSANANPDVVSAVIVGNEALLRKEVTGAQLAKLINKVKSQVKQPVTYADVWEFWLKHPEVAPAVDFLTIHLLPYWEDDPSNIDVALQHVADVRQVFGNKFAPKDVMIGETGWPSEGRQRETALPSRVNEAKFIRGFVAMAEKEGWHYNLIEAFDQPWKRGSEGAVGGYWGLFDADRQDKGVLAGPVTNVPYWKEWLGRRRADFPRHAAARRPGAQHAIGIGPAAARCGGCLLDRRLGRSGAGDHAVCQRMAVGRLADRVESVGAGARCVDLERPPGWRERAFNLAGAPRRLAGRCGRFCRCGDDAGDGVRRTLSQLRQHGVHSAGAGVRVPPGQRAAPGNRPADLHHRRRDCPAAV